VGRPDASKLLVGLGCGGGGKGCGEYEKATGQMGGSQSAVSFLQLFCRKKEPSLEW